MRDAATQDRQRNECAKWWIFRKIAKWRRWRHAPWLTATAVITDSSHRFSKRWHVADVKNIAGDDQTTLMVHRNSANIACLFHFTSVYVCAIATVVPQLTAAAIATHRRISKKLHVADVKNLIGDDQIEIPQFRFVYIYTIATDAPAAASRLLAASDGFWKSLKRHVTDVKDIAEMTRIDRNSAYTKMYAYEIKQNVSKNFFFMLRTPPQLTALRTVFSCYHWQRLLFSHSKNSISQRPWPPPKNRDIHIVEFCCRFYL